MNEAETRAEHIAPALKERLGKEGSQLVTNCHQLKMAAGDGKQRFTDVATAERSPEQSITQHSNPAIIEIAV